MLHIHRDRSTGKVFYTYEHKHAKPYDVSLAPVPKLPVPSHKKRMPLWTWAEKHRDALQEMYDELCQRIYEFEPPEAISSIDHVALKPAFVSWVHKYSTNALMKPPPF